MRVQVPVSDRTAHINTLMRQLVDWALSPSASTTTAVAAAAAASRLGQQLQLHDHTAAASAAGLLDAGSSNGSRARQQQLLQLPLDSSEEVVLVAVLRERMAAGKTGGHLLPLYLLQVCAARLVLARSATATSRFRYLQEASLAWRSPSHLVTPCHTL